jgi:hypothetical protein
MKVYSFLQTGVAGGGGVAQDLRKTQKLPQKVWDGKDHYQLFMCIVVYAYNYTMTVIIGNARTDVYHCILYLISMGIADGE